MAFRRFAYTLCGSASLSCVLNVLGLSAVLLLLVLLTLVGAWHAIPAVVVEFPTCPGASQVRITAEPAPASH